MTRVLGVCYHLSVSFSGVSEKIWGCEGYGMAVRTWMVMEGVRSGRKGVSSVIGALNAMEKGGDKGV